MTRTWPVDNAEYIADPKDHRLGNSTTAATPKTRFAWDFSGRRSDMAFGKLRKV